MNLSMTGKLAAALKSGSQRAGRVTEAWGVENFYCPNCSSPKLDWLKPGTKANDYRCPKCGFWFQLKSQKSRIGNSITDGAYGAMMEAIKFDRSPNFFFLHYDLATWSVRNLLLVPHFAFPPSAIIKRPPLSATARRAGWVGCNFNLARIPAEARIPIIITRSNGRESAPIENQSRLTPTATIIVPPAQVRAQFKRVKPLEEISIKERGWTLDVLSLVRRVMDSRRRGDESLIKKSGNMQSLLTSPPTNEFTNEEIYAFAPELEKLHPDNRHVRDKIRQQLQVLRDAKLLIHVGPGRWKMADD